MEKEWRSRKQNRKRRVGSKIGRKKWLNEESSVS